MHWRLARLLAGCCVLTAAVLLIGAFTSSGSHPRVRIQRAFGDELSPLAARHLGQASPGPGVSGEASRDPDSVQLVDSTDPLAYPAQNVSLSWLQSAQGAAKSAKGKFPRGKGRTGSWVSVGPDTALYGRTPIRTGYVPNNYVASGRADAVAISATCRPGHCRMWVGPAGGGVWRTDNALAGTPHWTFLTLPAPVQTVGSITLDPNDRSGNTVWVGTGEPNACASGCGAGVGLFRSTDGGDTWTGPYGKAFFEGRGVGAIVVQRGSPNVMYAATTRAIRGYSSVCCDGVVSLIPGAAKWGLYKSTDGGTNWSYVFNGAETTAGCTGDASEVSNLTPCSPRGVRRVVLDPSAPSTVYASAFARGIWRSTDSGGTWTRIKPPTTGLVPGQSTTDIASIAVTTVAGKTRMYVGQGANIDNAGFWRTDDATAATPVFTQLSSTNIADPGYGAWDFCTTQCSYDNQVVTSAGQPNLVYLLGSYTYPETSAGRNLSNGRAVLLSTDAGVSWNDMTMDVTDRTFPNGLHPDEHDLVLNPSNPLQFFETSDGGLMRSSGELTDASAMCDGRVILGSSGLRPLNAMELARCKQLLSAIPTELESMNKGLSTLQFQSLSVNPRNPNDLLGGTQDNGTWESYSNQNRWLNVVHGDGGQSGFDVANPDFRFHTFFSTQVDVNFSKGDIADWNWIADPFFAQAEPAQFYIPILTDPVVSRTMYAGLSHVWRTKTWGMGSRDLATFRAECNTWFGPDPNGDCGDWVKLGDPAAAGRLTSATYGASKAGGSLAAVDRARGDASTLWAATSTGRLFISKNANAEPATAVTFTRLDGATTPTRFVTGIYVDPANSNRAWIAYSGFNAADTVAGHLFEVVFNGTSATFTRLDGTLGDLPLTDVQRDDATGDLYVSNDFGVLRLGAGETAFTAAAPGLPTVEVAGLTIVPGERIIYAATHGLGAWRLNLE